MLISILLWLVLFVSSLVVGYFITLKKKKASEFKKGDFPFKLRFKGVGIPVVAMMVIMSFVLPSAIGTVDAGQRGVVLQFGAVTDRTLNEGLYIVTPVVNSVIKMDVQTHKIDAPASAASKDLQNVQTTITLNYRLMPTQVNKVYQTLRKDYEARVIQPAMQESLKATTAQFVAEELITQRGTVKANTEENLRARMAPLGIEVQSVLITDFQFSDTFTASIESKQVAEQQALQAENELNRIEVEARQAKAEAEGRRDAAIEIATGNKRAAILEAEGQAEAILQVAVAQAEANDLINATITDKVIQYTTVQALSPGIRTVILPTGQNFILGSEVLGGN